MKPGICIALLRTSAICASVTGFPLLFSITSVSGSVRKPGKVLSNSSCAWRTPLSGGRYFSLMPPRASWPSGMISRIITMMIGAAKAMGRFITRLTSLPQKPFSTSSRVLVFWVFSANQSMIRRENVQLRRNGIRSSVRTPSASMLGPTMARAPASTVTDSSADNTTVAMIAYVMDFRKVCGNNRSGTADDNRQAGGDHAAEHEEQHDHDQRHTEQLAALLVFADGSGQLACQRLQACLLHLDAGNVECFLDGLAVLAEVFVVVRQDRVVVVALELDRHERMLLVGVGHVLEHVRALEVADRAQDLIGVVLLDLGQVVQDLLLERRVVDGLALGGGVDPDDVAGGVATVCLVGDDGGMHGLAALVVEPALRDVLAQADSVDAATQAQRDHHTDNDVSVAVDRSAPPGEHLSS